MAIEDSQTRLLLYSLKEVEKIAFWTGKLRKIFEVPITGAFPVLDVLEFRFPVVMKGFRLIVACDDQFRGSVLATTQVKPPEITVRESVYRCAGEGSEAACLVLAHELGHLWLSHNSSPRNDFPFEIRLENVALRAEWQADELASELMMPSQVVSQMPPQRIASQFRVPLQCAEYRLELLSARRRLSLKRTTHLRERYYGLSSCVRAELHNWLSKRCEDCSSYNEREARSPLLLPA